jgi:hypothetical protein
VILLLLLLTAVSGAVWADHYQPLVNDGGSYWGGRLVADSSSFRGAGPRATAVENAFGTEYGSGRSRTAAGSASWSTSSTPVGSR